MPEIRVPNASGTPAPAPSRANTANASPSQATDQKLLAIGEWCSNVFLACFLASLTNPVDDSVALAFEQRQTRCQSKRSTRS